MFDISYANGILNYACWILHIRTNCSRVRPKTSEGTQYNARKGHSFCLSLLLLHTHTIWFLFNVPSCQHRITMERYIIFFLTFETYLGHKINSNDATILENYSNLTWWGITVLLINLILLLFTISFVKSAFCLIYGTLDSNLNKM